MPLVFELELVERQWDRVVVSLSLCPGDAPVELDGVAVEILDPARERVSNRLLLPISGRLTGPLVTQAELRSLEAIPEGCMVSATAWSGPRQLEAQCPADPAVSLEGHVRGTACVRSVRPEQELEAVIPEELTRLQALFPWLGRPVEGGRPPAALELATEPPGDEVLEPDWRGDELSEEEIDQLAGELGLDDDCSEWLKELMAE